MGLLVDATYCSILLFVFCDCSHKSTLTVKRTKKKIIHCSISENRVKRRRGAHTKQHHQAIILYFVECSLLIFFFFFFLFISVFLTAWCTHVVYKHSHVKDAKIDHLKHCKSIIYITSRMHTQYFMFGEFHRTDYFLEREFCTHHERLSPYHLPVAFLLQWIFFLLSFHFWAFSCHFILFFYIRLLSRFIFTDFLIFVVLRAFFDFHFRLLKVYRTRYFRLIYSMSIYQRKKRWFHFRFYFFVFNSSKFYLNDFSSWYKSQIDLFIQAIEMNPAVVSLKGYADVNRELLSSVSVYLIYISLKCHQISTVIFILLIYSQLQRLPFI